MGVYHQWHRKGRGLKLLSPDPPGKNWAGKLVLADECQDQQQWQQDVSTEPGQQVKPVLLQRAADTSWCGLIMARRLSNPTITMC